MAGPIIRAIEAGHVERSLGDDKHPQFRAHTCRKDEQVWPCRTMTAARKAQPDYGRMLQQANAIEAGKLSLR